MFSVKYFHIPEIPVTFQKTVFTCQSWSITIVALVFHNCYSKLAQTRHLKTIETYSSVLNSEGSRLGVTGTMLPLPTLEKFFLSLLGLVFAGSPQCSLAFVGMIPNFLLLHMPSSLGICIHTCLFLEDTYHWIWDWPHLVWPSLNPSASVKPLLPNIVILTHT